MNKENQKSKKNSFGKNKNKSLKLAKHLNDCAYINNEMKEM